MATNPAPPELDRWMLMSQPNGSWIIILVVDDTHDDELAHAVAREDMAPSQNFVGVWGAGERDGYWVVGFALSELGGGLERQWGTDNIHRELLETILGVPHTVAIMPLEIAGGAKTAAEVALDSVGHCSSRSSTDRRRSNRYSPTAATGDCSNADSRRLSLEVSFASGKGRRSRPFSQREKPAEVEFVNPSR